MRKRRWLRAALVVAGVMLSASWGLSRALQDGWARRSLLARLSASFGRPVEVGYFGFSLLSGLRFEAHTVSVAEDPRFGAEYFLRADELDASPRWAELLRGRFELGTLSITNASLNLVRAADGHWNIESWLPSAPEPPGAVAAGSGRPQAAVLLAHIEVDGGRINFKREVEKLPFALVDVSGSLDQDGAGRWNIDLQAHPARASVAVQDAGTLHLRGTVAGTSARLRPASLALFWEDASVADALRLASGGDHGVRGELAAELTASVEDTPPANGAAPAAGWNIGGVVRLTGMHRWDLAAKATDPAVNVSLTAAWMPGQPQLRLVKCLMEAPHSHLSADGELNWLHGFNPSLHLADSRVGLEDILAWRQAFLPGIAEDLATQGTVSADAMLAGWPPRLEQATLESTGAILRAGALALPIRFGPIRAKLDGGLLLLSPVEVRLPGAPPAASSAKARGAQAPPAGVLHVAGQIGPFRPGESPSQWTYRVTAGGSTTRVEDLLAVATAFGHPAASDWAIEGSASMQLAFAGAFQWGASMALGTLALNGVQLTSVLMNQTLVVSSASVELRPGDMRVKLDAAQALGARWKGSLEKRAAEGVWSFDLSADRLDSAELDRWLGPRARPTFFERLLPFGGPPSLGPAREAALARLSARGRLRVAELTLAPLRVVSLDADAQLDGRNITLHHAQGEFYGGRMTGEFQAQLTGTPQYSFSGQFSRMNLAALAAATTSLSGRLAGLASGDLTLTARGIEKTDLLASLEGSGSMRVRDPVLQGLDFVSEGQDPGGDPPAGSASRFSAAVANFHVADGQVRVDESLLSSRDAQLEASGNVDFTRRLDLRAHSAPGAGEALAEKDSDPGRDSWIVGGTLDAPEVTRPTNLARARTGSGGGAHR